MNRADCSADSETITVHIPITFWKRTRDGPEWAPRRPRVDNAMAEAFARRSGGERLESSVHMTL
jgi:hypothetical protein